PRLATTPTTTAATTQSTGRPSATTRPSERSASSDSRARTFAEGTARAFRVFRSAIEALQFIVETRVVGVLRGLAAGGRLGGVVIIVLSSASFPNSLAYSATI